MASDRTRVAAIRAMELEDVDAVMAIETAAQLTPWNSAHFHDCLGNTNYPVSYTHLTLPTIYSV